MKKAVIILMTMFCILTPVKIFAAEAVNVQSEQKQEAAMPAPISVDRKNIDGTEYLIKTFETAAQTEPSSLVEENFELDGYFFTHQTTDKKVNEESESKEISEETKAESQSKSLEEVIKLFPATKAYNQDGFKGTLTLDTGSIITEVAGYTTKRYTVSTTKEYPGLMYADNSYVSQTAAKDGYTLPLTDVNWVVTGTGLAGDSLVPTEYKAIASYAKTFSSQVPTGYVSTARYKGTVTKTKAGTTVYTLTYVGMPIVEDEPVPTGMPLALKIVTGIILVLLAAGAVVVLILFLKSRKGADIYNLMEKEYICIGHQAVNPKEPVIDLNEFDDMIQSNVFQFILDKKTTKKLYGRNVAVTLKDVTVKHLIKGQRNEEYKFDLDLGGVLDAE